MKKNVKLHKEIENLQEKYVSVWEDILSIESPTSDKAGVDMAGEYFIRLAKEQGWKVEVFEQPVAGNVVCITMNANSKLEPVTFSGHIDTVHPKGMFGYPPVKKDGEKIYGPGAVDCKGGVVAGFLAMEALKNVGFTDRPVRMLLQTDEEIGSRISNKATINYMCEKAKDSIAFFNLEGHNNGDACIGRKGIITFEFTVHGQEAHSSACAMRGANAILDASYKIIELEKMKDGAILVNTARGRVVDEPAMIEELKTGRFKAILDVYYHEPLEADSPLRTLENVYCIPHLAGPTVDRRAKITAALARNIVDWAEGREVYLEITKEQAARMTVGG